MLWDSLLQGIINVYGTIGYTNYGFVDKEKFGIVKELDEKEGEVHTFSDDLVAAATSRMAHQHRDKLVRNI